MREVLKGKEIVLGQDMSNYIKEPLRTPLRLDQARNQLSGAKGRLYHAMFWFVDSNKIDHAALYYLTKGQQEKAEQILLSQNTFSSLINLAVIRLLEERYDEAMELYTQCFQNEEFTQDFVNAIIGNRYKVKGIFMLSKVLDELKKAKERKERDDNADERSYVGAGAGMVYKATSGSHLIHPRTQVTSIETMRRLQLVKNFDRHLFDSLNGLIARIDALNNEYNTTNDFGEMDLNPNLGALLVLDEFDRYLMVNNSLIETFMKSCQESRQRDLIVSYLCELIGVIQGTLNLYVAELGRLYTPNLVQRIRSLKAKLKRLYFRYKSNEIDLMLNDIEIIEDVLPYYRDLAQSFEENIAVNDDEQLIKGFYKFYASSIFILNRFAKNIGLSGEYSYYAVVLQDMVVRYNITYISVLTNLALRHPESQYLKARSQEKVDAQASESNLSYQSSSDDENAAALEQKQRNDEREANEAKAIADNEGDEAQEGSQKKYYPVVMQPASSKALMAERYRDTNYVEGKFDKAPTSKAEAKAMAKHQKSLDKMRYEKEKRRKDFFKKRITRERAKLLKAIDSFDAYTVFKPTGCLIDVTKDQLNRLAPPVTGKTLTGIIILLVLAFGAVYMNIHMDGFMRLVEQIKSMF